MNPLSPPVTPRAPPPHSAAGFAERRHQGRVGLENSYSSKLHIWQGWTRTVVRDPPSPGGLPGPHNPAEFARRLYACESLEPAAQPRAENGVEPYTLQWFL